MCAKHCPVFHFTGLTCIIRLGAVTTKLPRSELVLDFKKFFSCFAGDLSSPKIFLCLIKYSSESINLCEGSLTLDFVGFCTEMCDDVRSGDRSENKRHLTESKTNPKPRGSLLP